MTWVRLSDDYYEHEKFGGVSYRAELLWVRALAYSNRRLTDGELPVAAVARLGADLRSKPPKLAAELVDAGLWHPADGGGYVIHDYLDYQPPRAATEAKRAARSAAGRLGAARRWSGTTG